MLLGRERELSVLTDAVARKQAIIVVGEAGVGKTALLREAADISGRPLFEGGGLSALDWMDHFALSRALGRTLDVGDAAAVAALVAEEVDDGVLVIDDLQWVDHATIQVLPFLVGRIPLLGAIRRGDPAAGPRQEDVGQKGFNLLDLEGLGTADAAVLVRQRRADLPADVIDRIVDAAHGNPLLLEQLALLDAFPEALRLGLGARLRAHSAEARQAVARVALLGRPAERDIVGDQAGVLVQAGLLIERHGLLDLRHQLLGGAALEELDGAAVRRLHSELARAVGDLGEAARHHAEAGEESAAYEKALAATAATSKPGERASHLKIAAAAARGEAADDLRLEAVEALVAAGDYRGALELIPTIVRTDAGMAARTALAEARAHRKLGNRDAAELALAAGNESAAGTGTPAEAELRLEEVDVLIADWDPSAPGFAREALDLARQIGAVESRAQLTFALAEGDRDAGVGAENARIALEMARQEGNGSLECEAALVLAECLISDGRPHEAYPMVLTMADHARGLALRSREYELLHIQAYLELYNRGDLRRTVSLCRELLTEPAVLGDRMIRTQAYMTNALAALGRDSEATAILDEVGAGTTTADDRLIVLYSRSLADWWAGRFDGALRAAAACRSESSPFDWVVTVIGGWAGLESGSSLPEQPRDAPPTPHIAAVIPEGRALLCLAESQAAEAEHLFEEAASLWQGSWWDGELRCMWGAGLAALYEGSTERSRKRLLEAEQVAQAAGHAPMLRRIERSLRQAGVRRSTGVKSSARTLSAREQEVLDLVGEGLRTREIATRLGVAPSTVDSQIKSAMRKLNSRTRAQAVVAASNANR
jgi:DNA-binding CsgD family transcriptional regulator